MKKLAALIFFLMAANLIAAPTERPPEQRLLQSEIQSGLACFCGCGMTIQGCLGGMTCSESRAISKQVAALLENGKTKAEVMQAMVAQYGERILAAPTKTGFNLTAWILPFVALVAGGVIVARVIASWKRQAPGPKSALPRMPNPEERSSSDPYQERLERELREFDK
jgi:cytochrome c-type biogenesis protein CcmH/NrfF